MNKTIGVMGCGWLGLPLAKILSEKGYSVRGTTTSNAKVPLLQENGIEPYVISLGEEIIEGDISSFLNGMDTIVINVPPGLRTGKSGNYVQKMKRLHQEIRSAGVGQVLFVSSTSVYGMVNGKVDEKTTPQPNSESGKQLFEAESLFSQDKKLQTTIVRFGGLIGPWRHPARQLSGRKELKNGHHPVNLIHLEDCLHLILTILEQRWWGTVINGVYPDHPTKKNYYTIEAEKMGLPVPNYSREGNTSEGKIVESVTLEARGFIFSKGIRS